MKNLVQTSFLTLGLLSISFGAFAGGDASNGEKIASAQCVACHGVGGNSTTPLFPKLAGLGEKYILKQLEDIKNASTGANPKKTSRQINEMTGLLDSKSDSELADIAAYYASQTMQLSGAKEMQVQVNSGDKVDALKLGAKVYRGGNLDVGTPACSGCHSPRGLGNSPAGFPRLSGQHADYIEKQLKAFRAGDRTNDGDTQVMRDIASKMSDAEIKAVANFISGLN